MGASAAAYLAERGKDVALVAAGEGGAHGRYSSHGDVSRVARKWSNDPVWAQLGRRSLSRFRDIESSTGVSFFTDVGSLLVVAEDAAAQHRSLEQVLAGPDSDSFEHLSCAQLRHRFSYLNVGDGSVGVLEPTAAGYFDPRAFVTAQIRRGQRRGLTHIEAPMEDLGTANGGGHLITLADGGSIHGQHVLLAVGAYSRFESWSPVAHDLTVFGRTIIHVEVEDGLRRSLRGMPSVRLHGASHGYYMVPPMQYPDGRWYLKIGGGPRTEVLASKTALQQWCAGEGDPAVAEMLLAKAQEVIPDLVAVDVRPQTCIITVPPGGHPYITRGDTGIGVLTGGNGAGAKSGDELGRLAAAMMSGEPDWAEDYGDGVFEP